MLLGERFSNVVVIADDITASFYASSGIQFISAESLEGPREEAEFFIAVLKEIGCELLLVTEEKWEKIKNLGLFEKLPPVVIIPSFKTGSTKSLPVLRSLSEKALGFSYLAFEEEESEEDE
jgi:vacuolar-type H+-ATPase subunit F/Vma7